MTTWDDLREAMVKGIMRVWDAWFSQPKTRSTSTTTNPRPDHKTSTPRRSEARMNQNDPTPETSTTSSPTPSTTVVAKLRMDHTGKWKLTHPDGKVLASRSRKRDTLRWAKDAGYRVEEEA